MQKDIEKHKSRVVIQLSDDNADVQKATISHINNLLLGMPGILIELVIHSHGINFVFRNSHWQHKLEKLSSSGVKLLVCRNAMDSMNLESEDLLPIVEIIPSAVVHLVLRQQNGWSYLKAGF